MTRKSFGLRVRSWLILGLVIATIGGITVAIVPHSTVAQVGPQHAAAPSGGAIDYAKSLSQAFREAAEKVLPSVVTIQNRPPAVEEPKARSPESEEPDWWGSPFDDWFRHSPEFRRFFREMPPFMPRIPRGEVIGTGSGVIIDASGVILTNNHVVEPDGKIVVRLMDGREFDAVDIKRDPKSDLAIVRIKGATNLQPARFGDSDKLAVGDWVLALGGPFGLEGSVTAGIISAKGRPLSRETRADYLQTDAAINPGSSGGPLINLDGEVVGINTAIRTATGVNEGVGFAAPSNLAKWVADQLMTTGTVKRAYLGVLIQPLTQQLADQFGVKAREGVLVGDVQPNSPAAAAGLKPGDLILRVDGKPVGSVQQLVGLVDRSPIGGKCTVEILRDGKRMPVEVTLREQPSDYGLVSRGSAPGRPEGTRVDKLGLEVGTLTAEVAEQLGLKAGVGVVITGVAPGSLADRAGLETGMVITEVNRKPVRSVQDFNKALEAQPLSKGVLLLIRTAEGSRFVAIRAD